MRGNRSRVASLSAETSLLRELPPCWALVRLGDIARLQPGYAFKSAWFVDEGVRLLRGTNIVPGGTRWDEVVHLSQEQAVQFREYDLGLGDIVIAMDRPVISSGMKIARLSTADLPSLLLQRVGRFIPFEGLHSDYLFHFVQSHEFQAHVGATATGTQLPHISQTDIESSILPLPPLNEQRRIVAKIEELSARNRRAREALDAVPALLEQFRQSVLAAAFRGDLTADWRKAHPGTEPASTLLDRIRQERRRRWEQANPKKRYVEPDPVDTTDLPELPEGWCWSPLPLIAKSELGKMLDRSKHVTGRELPYLRNVNVRWGEVETNDLLTMFFEEDEIERYKVFPGDVVVCEGGEPGRASVWPVVAEPIMYQKALHRVRPLPGVVSWWIVYSLWNDAAAGRLLELMSGTTIKHLTGEALARYTLPLAPEAEQSEIVCRMQTAMDMLSGINIAWMETTDNLNACEQSILAKAFRGELVPQDPADEPATVLLERIRAAREAAGTPRKTGRRGRRRGGVSGNEAQDAGEPAPAPAALEQGGRTQDGPSKDTPPAENKPRKLIRLQFPRGVTAEEAARMIAEALKQP